MKNKIIAQILLFNWLLSMAFTWFTLYDPIPRGSATSIMEAGFWINLVFFVPLAGIRLLRSKP